MALISKKREREGVQIPLTSLIDIVFLLLIYFLLTTNFLTDEGIEVKLPRAEAAKPQTQKEITVAVDGSGRVWLENREARLDELFGLLKERIDGQPDRLVVIKADRSIVLNRAVQVMDVAKAAGAGRLCLATEKGM